MFTGIITDIGRIAAIEPAGDPRLWIATRYPVATIAIGASIAHSGVCLTVTETDAGAGTYRVQVSAETLGVTTARFWKVGTRLNLERALKLGDELGGHIVSGHVDGVGTLISATPEADSLRLIFEVSRDLARLIARKGSVAIDGVSLTVNAVEGRRFGVNIIPHTQAESTLGTLAAGDPVNIEIDMLARYVQRLIESPDPELADAETGRWGTET